MSSSTTTTARRFSGSVLNAANAARVGSLSNSLRIDR
jgi:hypothetical protein